MRILCHIFGCELEDRSGGCRRCGTWIYDWPFIQPEMALLHPWYKFTWWLIRNKRYFYHRCDVCETRQFFTEDYCCSQKCYDDWYPF
jgi:hypothetical protein